MREREKKEGGGGGLLLIKTPENLGVSLGQGRETPIRTRARTGRLCENLPGIKGDKSGPIFFSVKITRFRIQKYVTLGRFFSIVHRDGGEMMIPIIRGGGGLCASTPPFLFV